MAKDYIQMDLLGWNDPPACDIPREADDGVTADRLEDINIKLPSKSSIKLKISLSRGDSGSWYFGISVKVRDGGMGYAAYPKFSEKFTSRDEAINAAIIKIMGELSHKNVKKEMPEVLKALQLIAPADPEDARRDGICKEWRECEYRGDCFTPKNEIDSICFKSEPHKLAYAVSHAASSDVRASMTYRDWMSWGYSSNESKILAAGFRLVKYDRSAKTLHTTFEDPRAGWQELPARETFAAAERDLKKLLEDPAFIQVSTNGVNVQGGTWAGGCWGKLKSMGFEFYRKDRSAAPSGQAYRIKIGSLNWSTLSKHAAPEEMMEAWNELMQDPFALED